MQAQTRRPIDATAGLGRGLLVALTAAVAIPRWDAAVDHCASGEALLISKALWLGVPQAVRSAC
jgi:hypothetical protein